MVIDLCNHLYRNLVYRALKLKTQSEVMKWTTLWLKFVQPFHICRLVPADQRNRWKAPNSLRISTRHTCLLNQLAMRPGYPLDRKLSGFTSSLAVVAALTTRRKKPRYILETRLSHFIVCVDAEATLWTKEPLVYARKEAWRPHNKSICCTEKRISAPVTI
jgi:hypothetical protein